MSLFDIDKNSEDRGSPMPNTHDKLIDGAIKSHKTISTHYSSDADTNTGRLQMQNKQVLGNDGTTNTTLHGYNQALNQWGFFVTKPGVEVTTNTDPSQFIFNSSQDAFKIVKTGTIPLTYSMSALTAGQSTNSVIGTATVNHNLGFIPGLMLFSNTAANLSTWVPVSYGSMDYPVFLSTVSGTFWHQQAISTTQLILEYSATFYNSSGTFGPYSGTINYRYYLLQETAN